MQYRELKGDEIEKYEKEEEEEEEDEVQTKKEQENEQGKGKWIFLDTVLAFGWILLLLGF